MFIAMGALFVKARLAGVDGERLILGGATWPSRSNGRFFGSPGIAVMGPKV
jgi:hypothetical protein